MEDLKIIFHHQHLFETSRPPQNYISYRSVKKCIICEKNVFQLGLRMFIVVFVIFDFT